MAVEEQFTFDITHKPAKSPQNYQRCRLDINERLSKLYRLSKP